MTSEEAKKAKNIMSQMLKDEEGFLSDNIVEAHKTAIKALNQEPQWIPVSEKLPTSDDDVLVTNGIGMYIGWIDPTDKRWRVDSESEYFMENVIAWMPLPKPYVPDTNIGKMLEIPTGERSDKE